MSIKGWAGQEKKGSQEFACVAPTGPKSYGLEVRSVGTYQEIGSDATESGSGTQDITATAHGARVGDLISFTSGDFDGIEAVAIEIPDANTIRLGQTLASSLGVGVTFDILRPKALQVSSGGGIAQGPVQFVRDGTDTEVSEDTATPANSRPLPVKITDVDGDVKIDATNLNLHVQLEHSGDDADSVRIGDGTETLGINADGSLNAVVTAEDLDVRDLASGTDSVSAVLQDGAGTALTSTLVGADQSLDVNVTQSALPTGAATETTLDAVKTAVEGTLTVQAADLDVRDLSSASDSVSAVQSGIWSVDLDAGATVKTSNLPDTVDTNAGAAGASTIRVIPATDAKHPQGRSYGDSVRLAYSSTSVTTSAWVELIASTAADINELYIFDSSGQTLEIGTGAAASETRVLIVPPGGFSGPVNLRIPSGTRVAIKAISATADSGEISITGLN